MNPLGTNNTEYNYRIKYTKKWTTMISNSILTPIEALCAYRTVSIPDIMYSMRAVYFSKAQCQTLQNLAAQDYLPKLDFNRKLPKEIIFGPTTMEG